MSGTREVTRLEGFSDAVFGFAITLLVVSLEVPTSFANLMDVFRGLPVFAITFALLLLVWHEHHAYFRRYAIQDGPTIWLNGALLFVVIVYIYPLKFLFTLLIGPSGGAMAQAITRREIVQLMVLYGIGFASIFLLLAVMYWRAARLAPRLGHDERARLDALVGAGHSLVYVLVAVLSIGIALTGSASAPFLAGIAYGVIGPAQAVYHVITERAVQRRFAPVAAPSADAGDEAAGG